MLNVHVLRPGGHRYYLDALVPGRPEGTELVGEAPGRWFGQGTADLHLSGRVEGPDFELLLAGRHPLDQRQLRRDRADGTAGFDLTFAAPKSVSILRLLAPTEMADAVGDGHAAAVTDAAGYLERTAAGVRRAAGGRPTLLDATGVVAGAFLHRTSRALDPHLHTHLVVANVAQGVDGAWSTLDSRRLFRHLRAARALYHARLRHELTTRLGAAWEVRPSGMGDVVGVDPVLRRLFSGRAADVDEHVHRDRSAGRGWPARRVAALVTRPDKDRGRAVDDLVHEWRSRALDHGYPPSELTRVVGLARSRGSAPATPERAGSEPGPDLGVLERRLRRLDAAGRWLAPRDLVAEVAVACPAGAPAGVVEALAGRLAGGIDGRRQPGRSHSAIGGEDRWHAGRLAAALDAEADSTLGPGRVRVSVGPPREPEVGAGCGLDHARERPRLGLGLDRGWER